MAAFERHGRYRRGAGRLSAAVLTTALVGATLFAQEVDSSRRAALGQWWTTKPRYTTGFGAISYGGLPQAIVSDGVDLWVAVQLISPGVEQGYLVRFRGSDGSFLGAWGDYPGINSVFFAANTVLFTTGKNPGALYAFMPGQYNAAPVKVVDLGARPASIAYGGSRFWIANFGEGAAPGSVSIVTPGQWSVKTITTGFTNPVGIIHDGNHAWVTDNVANKLFKLANDGSILKTVTVGDGPEFPVFDGKHIWVPNVRGNSVTVVDRGSATVEATLTGNGLFAPQNAAFDGKRVLVTNPLTDTVSLWNAKDLSEIGSYDTGAGTHPGGACSDGVDFWLALFGSGQIGRF